MDGLENVANACHQNIVDMENKTLILTITLGEYDDRNTTVLAVSKDRGKLEAYREEHMAKRTLRIMLNKEYEAELSRLRQLHPFTEPMPVAPPKPVVPPRTKEEHAARVGIKGKYLEESEKWRKNNYEHEHKLGLIAKETTLIKYDLKGYDFTPRGFFYGYESAVKDTDYDIFEVREL